MKPVVRLQGDDATVRAVAREAITVLRRQPTSDLFSQLWALHDRRRRILAEIALDEELDDDPLPALGSHPRSSRRAHRVVWGWLLGVGLTAALVAAVQFDAPTRRNAYASADADARLAMVAVVVAIALLLVTLLLKVPDPASARVGETVTVIVALPVAGILAYRLVRGVHDRRGFTTEQLHWAIPALAVTLLLLVGIVARCDPVRRRKIAEPRIRTRSVHTPRPDVARELHRTAERLATTTLDKEAHQAWKERLDLLRRRGWPEETIAQAASMTPAAWLAWLCYDGEIDIGPVVPRR